MSKAASKSLVKKQHYVPQFYMKFWNGGTNGKTIWQYVKREELYIRCQTDEKNCCNCNYLYEIDNKSTKIAMGDWDAPNYLEKCFSEKEAIWASQLRDLFSLLDRSTTVTAEIQPILADFIASLFCRNPCIIDKCGSRINELVKSILSVPQIKPLVDWSLQQEPNYIDRILPAYISRIGLNPDFGKHTYKNYGPIEGIIYGDFLNDLLHRRMFLLQSKGGPFVFNDVPVVNVVFPDFGYIACPLSPQYAVMFIKRRDVNTFVKYTGFASNKINGVSDTLFYSIFSPYIGPNHGAKIFGKDEKSIRCAVEQFNKIYMTL